MIQTTPVFPIIFVEKKTYIIAFLYAILAKRKLRKHLEGDSDILGDFSLTYFYQSSLFIICY